jgi:hypothetical protein
MKGGFMKKTINPHPKSIRDEDTGIAIPNNADVESQSLKLPGHYL